MKFTVTFKDPDGPHECIEDAAKQSVESDGIKYEDEREAIAELRRDKLQKLCGKWFKYGEYIDVEIDTEAGTCTVLEAK